MVRWARLAEVTAFNPDVASDPAVVDLRRELATADAVVFSTPEYAGTLPGAFKNALVGSGELYRKLVAWINVAAPARGAGAEAVTGVGPALCGRRHHRAGVPADTCRRGLVSDDGLVHDPGLRSRLAVQLASVAGHIRSTGIYAAPYPLR